MAADYDKARGLCLRIPEPDVLAHCLTDLARLRAREAPQRAAEDCGALSPGPWRDECFFFVAEASAEGESWALAPQACGQAGSFSGSCLMHLWAIRARQLQHLHGVADAAAPFTEALAWSSAAGLQPSEQLEVDAWVQFHQVHLQGPEVLDLAPCAELDSPQGRYCRLAGARTLMQRVNLAIQALGPEALAEICAQPAGGPGAAFLDLLNLHYQPDSDLLAAAALARSRTCRSTTSYDGAL